MYDFDGFHLYCLLCNHEIIFRPNEWPPAAFQQNTHLNEMENNSQIRNIFVCICHRYHSLLVFSSCTLFFFKKTNFISILWKKYSKRTNTLLSASISPGFHFINHETYQWFWCKRSKFDSKTHTHHHHRVHIPLSVCVCSWGIWLSSEFRKL